MTLLDRFGYGASEAIAPARTSKRIILSYIFDYVIIVVLMVGFLAMDKLEPFHQQFSLQNYTLHYKYAVHERIPNLPLVGIAVLSPAVIITLWTLVVDGIFSHKIAGRKQKYTMSQRLWELNCGLLGLGLSISMQYVFVASLKNAIGKPRPDLIDRCQPVEGSVDPAPFGLSNSSICTQSNNAILKDGFRSFPSGHSSTSFGGLYYLSLYLAGKLHILDSRGEVWKLFVVMAPSLGAALVAGSRIMDARHHPFDVLSGSLIGILLAWAAYRQYFPSISNFQAKGRAFPMRTWGGGPIRKHEKEGDEPFVYQAALHADDDNVGMSSSNLASFPMPQNSNLFREEINASQRQRKFDHSATRRPVGGYPEGSAPPPVPLHNVRPGGNLQRHASDNGWENVSVNDQHSPNEYELQPQYTLNQASGQEPYHASEDTSYKGANPNRLPSMRTAEGQRVFPSPSMTKTEPKSSERPKSPEEQQHNRF